MRNYFQVSVFAIVSSPLRALVCDTANVALNCDEAHCHTAMCTQEHMSTFAEIVQQCLPSRHTLLVCTSLVDQLSTNRVSVFSFPHSSGVSTLSTVCPLCVHIISVYPTDTVFLSAKQLRVSTVNRVSVFLFIL